MDHTLAIEEAVRTHGLERELKLFGNEPFVATLNRDGERGWWTFDSFVTDAQVPRSRSNLETETMQIRGGTFLIVYRMSALVDSDTAQSRPNGTTIMSIFARKHYSPERLIEALVSVKVVAGS
jgi:hypothetical protein